MDGIEYSQLGTDSVRFYSTYLAFLKNKAPDVYKIAYEKLATQYKKQDRDLAAALWVDSYTQKLLLATILPLYETYKNTRPQS